MSPIYLLIKPASGLCNMRCRYCFYADVSDNRAVSSYGIMSRNTLEALMRNLFSENASAYTFAFQGGEPTLAGLDFFRDVIKLVEQYNIHRVPVSYAMQTNGYVIDDEWAQFLGKHQFLVGLSLDGNKQTHDCYRLDANGKGTYNIVTHAARLLERHGVAYNILTVVHDATARQIGKIYSFYKKSGYRYQQYIPCLDPFGEERGQQGYSLTPERYEYFLKTLFDCWYNDQRRGEATYNRYFENLVGVLLDIPPENCGMRGICQRQLVVEADGGVYPCDFYVLDRYRLGNLTIDSLTEIEKQRDALGFISDSKQVNAVCSQCRWYALCRGGCRRDREQADGSLGLNYYCKAYQAFFAYSYERLCQIARNIREQQKGTQSLLPRL